MQAKYGYRVLNELEEYAAECGLERLTVYTHRQFMRALLTAHDAETQEKENEPEGELEEITRSLLKAAQPLLEKAPEELVRKIRRKKRKKPYADAIAALESFRQSRTFGS